MRWIAVGLSAGVALGLFTTNAAASLRSETLEAIHHVENPRNLKRPGRHGELGPYQFRSSTWRMHSDRPFSHALEREAADDVAAKHYEWICRGLRRNGFEETPYNIGLVWNAGLRAVVNRRAPRAAHNYAQRVANLVQDFSTARLAIASAE